MVLIATKFSNMFKCKCCKTYFNDLEYKQSLLRFLFETFFEIMICSLISFKMLEIKEIWGMPENVTFGIHLFVFAIYTVFLLKALLFFTCQMSKLVKIKRHEKTESLKMLRSRTDMDKLTKNARSKVKQKYTQKSVMLQFKKLADKTKDAEKLMEQKKEFEANESIQN